MNFLIIDTSTQYCSATLIAGESIFSKTDKIPREHNKYMLPFIDTLLQSSYINKKDLDFISYGVGPGSFVGVRLSAAAAQGFSIALNIPIIGFSSMYVIAKNTFNLTNKQKIAVVLDARIGDFYIGKYKFKNNECVFSSEEVLSLSEFESVDLEGFYTVGDGLDKIDFTPSEQNYCPNTKAIVDEVLDKYKINKQNNSLTNEVYPVYMRGTKQWDN